MSTSAIRTLPPLDSQQRYTIPETAAYLRCCRAEVYRKIARGDLRVIKDGKRTYCPGSQIILLSTLPALVA